MRTALIGHTGFVGGNIRRKQDFTDYYNSENISDIAGKEYDLVVSAGAKAEKWLINQNPEADLANIKLLTDPLQHVQAKQFVLISTVDVYPNPLNVDEDTPIDPAAGQPYGQHRLALETFVQETFPQTTVLRLPGLFGPGLKKNIIFDLLHDNNVDRIHADGVFQFYNLERLWSDIETAVQAGIPLLNMATEPVSVQEIAQQAFGINFTNRPEGQTAARYDFHTKHATAFGQTGNYLCDKETVLAEITAFVAKERNA